MKIKYIWSMWVGDFKHKNDNEIWTYLWRCTFNVVKRWFSVVQFKRNRFEKWIHVIKHRYKEFIFHEIKYNCKKKICLVDIWYCFQRLKDVEILTNIRRRISNVIQRWFFVEICLVDILYGFQRLKDVEILTNFQRRISNVI